MVEAFIEEGFLSYDDLTFLEPAQLAEIAGVTEDQAEDMIAFAEEAAERVEEQTKAARESDPRPAGGRGSRSATATATAPPPPTTGKAAFDSLFAAPAPAPAVEETAEAAAPEVVDSGEAVPTESPAAAPVEEEQKPPEGE